MELPENFKLYLMAPPQQVARADQYGLTPAHLAYRVGAGPHLFRTQAPVSARGGIMVLGCDDPGGKGSPEPFCQEIIRECAARGFQGVFCDFEGPPIPVLRRALEQIAPVFQKRGWSLYLPESYALQAQAVRVVIPTALSGGSLHQRLSQAAERFGADHLALGLEWVAQDFTLPAPDGSGRDLEAEELKALLDQRSPAVYFDHDLCAHYFTYMHTGQSAHFVLYDDAASMTKKLFVASELGIREGFLPDPGQESLLKELLAKP